MPLTEDEFRIRVVAALEALARPPETDTTLADTVKRIEKVASAARAQWFGFFGVLAYAGITLMGIRDEDFFASGATTTLPVVNFSVNLLNFFYFAPLLITVVHAYLHGLTEQLWRDLAEIEPQRDGRPIIAFLPVWLVIEGALLLRHVLRRKEAAPVQPSPLGLLGVAAMLVLFWAGAPVIVCWFWLRSTVLHDLTLSLWLGAAFLVCVATGWFSISGLLRALRRGSR